MMLVVVAFITLMYASSSVHSAHLPPGIQACKRDDPNLNECARREAQKALKIFANGNKEFGFMPLEPMEISEMSASSTGSISLEQTYKNMKIYGITTAIVDKFDIDLDKNEFVVVTTVPQNAVFSDYSIKGQLLLFPINSQGKANFTLRNVKMQHNFNAERITKGGEEYLNIKDFKSEFVEFDVTLGFDNLVAGNDDVSTGIANLLKESSNDIFREVKPSHEVAYAVLFKQLFNSVFSNVPLKELFI